MIGRQIRIADDGNNEITPSDTGFKVRNIPFISQILFILDRIETLLFQQIINGIGDAAALVFPFIGNKDVFLGHGGLHVMDEDSIQ